MIGSVRIRLLRAALLAAALFTFLPLSGHAQAPGTGSVVGRVAGDGDRPLAGALVELEGTPLRAITTERGDFRLTGVPAGRRTLQVRLIGFEPTRATVDVVAGEAAPARITMDVSAVALDEIVVEGQVGQAEAYNRQRTAASVRNVVSAEQMERFPDAQVPDALRRIPGVSARPDRGETGYIFIRGLSPDLTTVTIDGARIPSTAQTGRGVELSSIPAEMLESIEVIKAITPDMDADAIGGSINLRARRPTRSQFDGRIEGGSHSVAGSNTYRGGVNLGNVMGPFSYVIGGDFASQERQTQNTQFSWGTWQDQPVLNRLMLQHYPIQRSRYSVNSALNYAVGQNSNLFVRGFYSAYDTQEERHRVQFRLDNGTRTSVTEARAARVIRQARQYTWERRIWNVTGGGDHALPGGVRLDYHAALSQARRTEPYRNYFEFRQDGVDMLLDPSAERLFPRFRVTNSRNPNDMSDFRLMYYEWRLDGNRDRDVTGAVNLDVPLAVGLAGQSTLRFGAKVYGRDKNRDMSELQLPYPSSAPRILMSTIATDGFGPSITPRAYEFGPRVDWARGEAFWETNRAAFPVNERELLQTSNTEDYVAGERVSAAYAMGTFDLGAVQVIAGARYEHTANEYDGTRLVFGPGNANRVEPSRTSSSYGSLFPALHLRYRMDEATNVRFAVTRTIARPSFVALAPNEFVNFGAGPDGQVRRGNPELRPAHATNLDLLAERYFGSVGLVSAGVFWKDIRDFTFNAVSSITAGEYAGFELVQPQNGAEARAYGAEMALHTRLRFLPGALNGFGVFANYTFTESEADTEFGAAGPRRTRLPEQFRHVGNVALTYDRFGFSGLVSLNHQSDFVDSLRGSPEADRWGRHRTQIDANLSQRLGRNLRATLQLNNLTNEPYIRYDGTMLTPYELEYEGRWASLGMRFEL
jgi:TonB-dependent receptor